jgi:hypothetical protein
MSFYTRVAHEDVETDIVSSGERSVAEVEWRKPWVCKSKFDVCTRYSIGVMCGTTELSGGHEIQTLGTA